ncbi:MAG: alpha/beta hydrolase [Rhodospirillales bacterium]|nr:alpha/beta hydrolase [Rhodospirillales bacterium]
MIPVNTDESRVGPVELPDLMRGPDGTPVVTTEDRRHCQAWLRQVFARTMYGPIPPPPNTLEISRRDLPAEFPGVRTEEIALSLSHRGRHIGKRLTLWRPETVEPVPVIAGLAFLGAAGATPSTAVALCDDAFIDGFANHGVRDGRPTDATRGRHADRSPIPLITGAGFALLLSGYGEWVPDHPDRWQETGLWPFLQPTDGPRRPGAISLWAWAMLRLVDALTRLPEIDGGRIAVFGHSRLGKAALWAAANDERIGHVLVNNAGCAGTKLCRRDFGETLAHLTARYPHWLAPACPIQTARLPVDQHQLLACVAPRGLYVASAADDLWADPRGEYLALKAALPFWQIGGGTPIPELPDADGALLPGQVLRAGPLAWHLRPGVHDLTPWDWRHFMDALRDW